MMSTSGEWDQLALDVELAAVRERQAARAGRVERAELAAEITRLHDREGLSWGATARSLNARGWRTPAGSQWWPSTVRRFAQPGAWADYIRSYRQRSM